MKVFIKVKTGKYKTHKYGQNPKWNAKRINVHVKDFI